MRKINPLNDFIFKKLFSAEESKDLLISFLNAVLTKKESEKITDVTILESRELTRENINEKTGILDVRAALVDGSHVNIEVQVGDPGDMARRTLFYWGRMFSKEISKGQDYALLPRVITINIMGTKYIQTNKYHSTFHLWEDENRDCLLTDALEIHFIELPKFIEMPVKDYHANKLERWLAFFNKEIPENELKGLMEMDADIRNAEMRMNHFTQDKSTMELYYAREKALYDEISKMNHATRKGLKQGLEQGLQQGLQQGKIETARNLLIHGVDVDTIVKSTGLERDTVIELMNTNK